jgi:hypothetical protein
MHLESKNHSNKTKSHKNKDANNHYTIHQQPTPNTPNNPKRPASSVERKPDSVPQPQSKDHDQKMFATPTKK